MTKTSPSRLRALSAAALTVAAAAAAAVLSAAPAQAAAPPPQPVAAAPAPLDAERVQLSERLVHVFLSDIDGLKPMFDLAMVMAEGEMRKSAQKSGGEAGAKAYDRFSGWIKLFGDASWEEMRHDQPVYEHLMGRYMAQRFTVAELRAAVEYYDGANGKEIRTAMLGGMMDKTTAPSLTPAAEKAKNKFMNSPEGTSFLAKWKTVADDPAFQDVGMDLFAEWMPGAARRWGEKTEAAEEARKSNGAK